MTASDPVVVPTSASAVAIAATLLSLLAGALWRRRRGDHC
jgi:MYXO-CTERM domain-containing protein